ncbi:MAG: ATP-grasp domain-containing protein [Spirochaetales bacterium]|nr:ATP-grasp domain-containing protein [Spirochaetales bacterium]
MGEKIILAGAASVSGHDEIIKAFSEIGFEAEFIEAPFIKKYYKDFLFKDISYTDTIPENRIAIPLSEYWISQCIKSRQCAISEKALKASRSKKYFYNLLAAAEIPVPEIFDTIEKAKNFVQENNATIIVKPEGLFSGYAVKIVSQKNLNLLENIVQKAKEVRNNAVKLFEVKNNSALITELVQGDEYSADLFFCRGRLSLVRLCKKVVAEIHGTPCTAICQLVPCSEDFFKQMKHWCSVLFSDDNISFAQFDFIDNGCGQIVPIDFACRVGGGMSELFGECKNNVYADAVWGKQYQPEISKGYLTQFNYLPTKSGILSKDDFNLMAGKQFIYKHKEDFVPESPSSVASRIAVVVRNYLDATEKDAERLLIGDDCIDFWKNSRRK